MRNTVQECAANMATYVRAAVNLTPEIKARFDAYLVGHFLADVTAVELEAAIDAANRAVLASGAADWKVNPFQ